MKKTAVALLAVLVLAVCAPLARAQTDPSPSADSSAATAPAATAPAGALAPSDWYKLGGAFGPSSAWQFGLDTSDTIGACDFYGWAHKSRGMMILGPCRDVLILAKSGVPVYHVGLEPLAYDMLDVNHSHPYYLARVGFNVGGALSGFLAAVSSRIPYFETLTGWQAPAPLQYLGSISTIDGSGGPGVGTKPVYGGALKVNIPLADLVALFQAAGAK